VNEPIEQTRDIDTLSPHPRNYNQHPPAQIERLAASLRQFGQVRPIVVHRDTIIAGHGVYMAAQHLGYQTLRVTQLPDDWTDEQAMAYLVADNETRRGAEPDDAELAALLDELQQADFNIAAMGFDEDEYGALLDGLTPELPIDTGVTSGARPSSRVLPLDFIYTWGAPDATCCIAVQAGLKYGVRSTDYRRRGLCPYVTQWPDLHRIVFVDNEYADYDHALHLSVVQELRPTYATVRDVMTREQCRDAGIAYYPLDTILAWAEEIAQYAENVIVIPKFDCIDNIPDCHMLGYSVPSSYGGTPLSVDLFRHRRVHLLGGSWKKQLEHLAALGDAVVSIDNNYINRMAEFGQFDNGDGHMQRVQDVGCRSTNNPRYAALALSFGLIATKVNELHATSAQASIDAQSQEEPV
jgi:hypothetical protein